MLDLTLKARGNVQYTCKTCMPVSTAGASYFPLMITLACTLHSGSSCNCKNMQSMFRERMVQPILLTSQILAMTAVLE